MNDATEQLVSIDPLIVRRRVSWGECDPAGVVYTPRFPEYAASARDYWFRHVLGHPDRPHPLRRQIVFPMRAMAFDFQAMLEPDDRFDIKVRLADMRTRSWTLAVEATHEKGYPVFTATLTQVAYDQESGKAVAIPAAIHARLSSVLDGTWTPESK